jgi:uncharacterized membrane protein
MDGTFVWYTDSLAYDGYPYGLNHVDAVLLRGLWPLVRGLSENLSPTLALPEIPERNTLFFLCRMLRVFYGMIAFCALAWALRRREVPTHWRWLILLAAATAPLLSTVTHSASGDVGTDLFVMLALAFLAPARLRPSASAFFLCGIMIGCAFASKYHGLLAAATPGLLLLLQPWSWRIRIRLGALCGLGALGGFALLTPALFIRFGRTLKLIRENFRYIKAYGVDSSFFDLPLQERLLLSLRSNIPTVTWALGAALLLCAFALLLFCMYRFMRTRRNPSGDLAWDLSVLAMPFIALILALIGKPQIQPFHFSFLTLPLLLGVGGALLLLPPRLRLLPACALLALLADHASIQRNELFVWPREDTRQSAFRVSEELLLPLSDVRNFQDFGPIILEGPNLAVFRNSPQRIRLPETSDWLAAPREALPAIPCDLGDDWLFLHLPSFARDSRLIHLRHDQPWSRHLIDRSPRNHIPLHIQAGELPVTFDARLNGIPHSLRLLPGETALLSIDATRGHSFERNGTQARRHSLELRARGGDLLLRVGEPDAPGDPERVLRKLARSRYLDGTLHFPHFHRDATLLDAQHLPPARYRLDIDWPRDVPPPILHIENAQLPDAGTRLRLQTQRNDDRVSVEWTQPGDALFTRLRLEFGPAGSRALPWTLRPISPALPTETAPDIGKNFAFTPAAEYDGGDISIGAFRWPARLAHNEPLRLQVRATLRPEAADLRGERVLYVHLLDSTGRQVYARDIPLVRIAPPESPHDIVHDLGIPPLPPGSYRFTLGLYDPRIRVRLRPRILEGARAPENRLDIGTLVIEE